MLHNKRESVAVAKNIQEENPRNNQSGNSTVPRNQEDYFAQIFENLEGSVTEKLSQKFSRTKSRLMGDLSKLNDFLLKSQVRKQSAAVLGTSGDSKRENQEPNEDHF